MDKANNVRSSASNHGSVRKLSDPNPGYGKLSWMEWVGVVILTPVYALNIAVPKVLLRRISSRLLGSPEPSTLPDSVVMDMVLEVMRTVRTFFTPRQTRFTTRPGTVVVSRTLSSLRYSNYDPDSIFTPVQHSSFAGYWVQLPESGSPENADIIIYFLHGGGYCALLPHHYLGFFLRLLEALASEHGVKAAVLALDYSLAPEAVFPQQLIESDAGWTYLVDELGIPAKKIVAMGDSAGGNLLLSLLAHLADPHPDCTRSSSSCNATTQRKPGAVVLLSPWTTFRTSATSYKINLHHDLLSAPELEHLSFCFRGTNTPADDPVFQQYSEFVHPITNPVATRKTRNWSSLLPTKTWVGAGERELLVADIMAFVEMARGDGAHVEAWVGEGMWHDPWVFESMMPGAGDVDKFLRTEWGKEVHKEVLPITVMLAEVVARMMG